MTWKTDRTAVLLEAAYKLLKKQEASNTPINLLAQKIVYEDDEVTGEFLMNDIGMFLDIEGLYD